MNEHLEPVFNLLLPALDKAGIDYWVYGGVSGAAYVGKFIRSNKDIDIFVREADFERAKLILNNSCIQNNFQLSEPPPLSNGRRKVEIRIDSERLSMVPAYIKDHIVELKFKRGSKEYSTQILERVERNISGYKFFSPTDVYIKELFVNYLTTSGKKDKDKIKNYDAKNILTSEEYSKFYPNN